MSDMATVDETGSIPWRSPDRKIFTSGCRTGKYSLPCMFADAPVPIPTSYVCSLSDGRFLGSFSMWPGYHGQFPTAARTSCGPLCHYVCMKKLFVGLLTAALFAPVSAFALFDCGATDCTQAQL